MDLFAPSHLLLLLLLAAIPGVIVYALMRGLRTSGKKRQPQSVVEQCSECGRQSAKPSA